MNSAIALITATLVFTGPTDDSQGRTAEMKNCLISLKQKAKVSAQEPGVLIEFDVYEGALVAKDQRIGRIDDAQALLQREAAQAEYKTADEQANSDVNIRFAKASRNVAQAELEQAELANKQQPGTVSQAEVRRRRFALQKAELQIEQSDLELTVAKGTRDKKLADFKGTDVIVDRRQIKAPFNGVIVEQLKFRGEWMNPGDTIFRIVALDELWIEGFLKAADYSPSEVANKPVVVTAQVTDRQLARFEGQVLFVSPEVDPVSGSFRVKALVKNQREGNYWQLRPGLRANMTILLDEPALPPIRPVAAKANLKDE